MEKISCDIIKDILPIYVDDVVSEDTKKLVEEHLCICTSCKTEVEQLKKDIVLPINKGLQLSEAKIIKKMKKIFRNKKIMISMISVVVSIIVMIGIYSVMVLPRIYIPYDGSKFNVIEVDGELCVRYGGDDMAGTVSTVIQEVDNANGEDKAVSIIYFYSTPWSKLIASFENTKESIDENLLWLSDENEVDEVYYGIFNSRGIEIPVGEIMKQSELIWEK